MASEVAQLPGMVQAPPADTPEEIRDYQRIISLRNEIYMGKHPRFKPPSIVRPAPALVAAPVPLPTAAAASGQSFSKPTTATTWKMTIAPAASTPAVTAAAPRSTAATTTTASTAGRIEDVLLTKSDVLLKAETTLKRQRIEQEVRNQLEHKKYEARLGMEVKDGKAVTEAEDDVDLEAAMQEAGMRLKPVERPEDPSSVNKLKGFFWDRGERDDRDRTDGGDMERRSNDGPARRQGHVEERFDSRRAADVEISAGAHGAAKEAPVEPPHSRIVETLREWERRPLALPSISKPQLATSPLNSPQPRYSASGLLRSPLASPQPRFSATSQVRSPAAPQPVRLANVARVESQDRIIELENVSPAPPAQPVQVPSKRARQSSPEPYIKQESINASPFSRDDYGKRVTPAEIGAALRPSSRESAHPGRPPYRMPLDAVAHDYYQPVPPPYGQSPHRHPYEAYPYQDPYAYPPPPADYRRPYVPPYAAPPPASSYYAPRPTYDDYGRYGSRPPPSVRPPFPRRSASPSDPYVRRRNSRSVSPDRRRRAVVGSDTPGPMQRLLPAGSPSPKRARLMPDSAEPDLRGPGPAATEYPYAPAPRDRMYCEGRDPYYPPHHARYPEVSPFMLPRPESAMYRREEDYRGYREREYPDPSQVRPPMPLGGPYPPPPEYARPPTRAAIGVPPDGLEYPPRAGADYYGRADGRASVRPGEGAYIYPPRQPSVRPDAPEYYGDRAIRAASVRPDLEKDRYSIPPPSIAPPPPRAGYLPYGGVGGYRYRD